MNPTRSRFRRVAKWVGLAVWVMLAAFWQEQSPSVHWVSPESRWLISLSRGYFDIQRFTSEFLEDMPLQPGFGTGGFSSHGPSNWPFVGSNANCTQILIPLWLPLLAIALPTALLWYRDRRPPFGHCLRCGYDLTGNVSGVCPECGANTTPVMLKTSRFAHVLKWTGLIMCGMTVLMWEMNCIVDAGDDPVSVLAILIPVMIIGIPTILLWRQEQMPPPGHCRECGYNLTGNVSGRCPECGAKT